MATTPKASFADELDRIAARYESQFAGQSRATRNLDEMDAIIRDTENVLKRITSIPAVAAPAGLSELAETARQNITLYKNERQFIVQAKNAPPQAEAFAPLASTANLTFARWHRHFAGKSRGTRDLGLLDEMVADLEAVREGMETIVADTKQKAFAADLDLVNKTLEMYASEHAAIAAAYLEGSLDDRAGMLASRANDQFKIYQEQFAGQSRNTRRPALLMRMIAQLETIQDDMRALKDAGLSEGNNTNNIGIVETQLGMFKKELTEIRSARQTTKLADLMGMLGGNANEVMAQYQENFAGKDRKSRNLDLLSKICDQLGEIRRQMADLGRAEHNAANEGNLEIVTQQLVSFEREYELIEEAKKA
jgi:hypothetical protein